MGPPALDHPEFLALLERARKADGASTPRKHHIVPESYLRRWAEKKQIRVTEVDSCHTYLTSPTRAAKITDYYRVESEDINPELVPPLLFEVFFSEVEGWGKKAIDILLSQPVANLSKDLRALFARYLALQHTRGQTYRIQSRKSANDMFQLIYEGMTDDGIRALLRRHRQEPTAEAVQTLRQAIAELHDGTLVVEPQDAAIVGQAVRSAEQLGEYLYMRKWVVYRTPPVLLTCDEPVVLIGGPGLPRAERPGAATAGVVAFPLAPDAVLAMFRPDLVPTGSRDLNHAETAELNREILANAARWAFERPSRKTANRLQVPPAADPTATERFVGGLTRRGGHHEEIVRNYRPNRWAKAEHLPGWPVARWWARPS